MRLIIDIPFSDINNVGVIDANDPSIHKWMLTGIGAI
jgi:hypothetical protein